MANITVESVLKAKMLEKLISSDYYTDPLTAVDNGIVKIQLMAMLENGAFDGYGAIKEIKWYQNQWTYVETVSTEPTSGTNGGTDTNVSATIFPQTKSTNYTIGDTVYFNDGEASPTYYVYEVTQGPFLKQLESVTFDVEAGKDIVAFRLILFTDEEGSKFEIRGMVNTFESVYAYNNAGTMTISNINITIG